MTNYKSKRPIGGKSPIWVVVNETGKMINRNPSKDELKGLKGFPKENYKVNYHQPKKYTDEELLNYLTQFYKKYGRPPTEKDFTNNSEYPSYTTYVLRFGSWPKTLKIVGLDLESIVKKGIVETTNQKGRFGEILIRDHFDKYPIDLAGENSHSHCDGICPNGKFYDVKSSKLAEHKGSLYWVFNTNNKYKDKIEIYYFIAFNENYSELIYAWRVTAWKAINKDSIYVGLKSNYEFNVKNMKEYDITDKIRDVLMEYEFFNKIKMSEIKVAYNIQPYDGYIATE